MTISPRQKKRSLRHLFAWSGPRLRQRERWLLPAMRALRVTVAGVALITAAAVGFSGSGCASNPAQQEWSGVSASVVCHAEPWSYRNDMGQLLHTAHYDIHTTIKDDVLLQRLCDVMEGALLQYQRVAPGVPLKPHPMNCYIFATRSEWEQFTREHTGIEARLYLQINRGGYTLRDMYVSYYVDESATLSVAAHEGWHLFASTEFKGRLPPFLEEGIATMFEDINYNDKKLPQWNLRINRSRVEELRQAMDGHYMYPLAELCQKHAGNVVSGSGHYIDSFYAQSWAFATYLWAGDDGKMRPILRHLLSDVADGSVFDPTGVHRDSRLPWYPAGVRPMLEHYLGKPLEEIDADYQKFLKKVAYDEFSQQWDS